MAPTGPLNRRTWPIDLRGSRYLAVRAADLKKDEVPLSVSSALAVIERAVRNPADLRQLSELGRSLTRSATRGESGVNVRAITSALGSGELVILRRQESGASVKPPAEELVTEALKAAKEVKTWVEMEVVDMEGKPVANKRYVCVLPNGAIQEGVLDRTGKVRFEEIDPGNCIFMLTELDREAWERVS